MMRFGKILFIFSVFILGSPVCLWADEQDVEITASEARELSNPDWQNTIEGIKEQTQELLTENAKLSSEHEFLQEKLAVLQKDLEKSKARLQDLKSKKQTGRVADSGSPMDGSLSVVKKMSDLQNEIEALSRENSDLEKELADIQEKNRLWNIQVSTEQNKKRDLNLDEKYQESADPKSQKVPDANSAKLQEQLEQSLQNEKDLEQALDKLTVQNQNGSKELMDVKKNNRDLEQRVRELKRQIAQQQQINGKKGKTISKVKSKPPANSVKLASEKKALEAEVSKLNAELEAVSKKVEQNKEAMEKKRQLMNQVMHLDAQNQEMRVKIDALVNDASSR